MADRPTERPTSYTIGVCAGCGVQTSPHIVGCSEAKKSKWFRIELIEVIRSLAEPGVITIDYAGRDIVLHIDDEPREYGQFIVDLVIDGKSRQRCWYTDKSEET